MGVFPDLRRWVRFRSGRAKFFDDSGDEIGRVQRRGGSTWNDGRLQAAQRVRRGVLLHARIRARTWVCVIWGAGWVLPAWSVVDSDSLFRGGRRLCGSPG